MLKARCLCKASCSEMPLSGETLASGASIEVEQHEPAAVTPSAAAAALPLPLLAPLPLSSASGTLATATATGTATGEQASWRHIHGSMIQPWLAVVARVGEGVRLAETTKFAYVILIVNRHDR